MRIVRAKPEHAETLTYIAYSAKRHWGYPKSWMTAWHDTLTIRAEFIAANIAFVAIDDDTRVVGFYVLTTEDNGIHLDHLWIIPAAMGRGIGKALFEHATAEAKKLGCDSIKIEADPNAEGFYKRMGAIRTGTNLSNVEGEPRALPLLEFRL